MGRFVAALAVLAMSASSAVAAQDAKPEGTWKWSVERNGNKIETTLKLKLEGDKLSGTITGRGGTESAIEEASFKDGTVSFSVSRDRNGQKVTTKYSGKLEGDAITGKIEGGQQARDWKAERVKA
ncbi:MAG TPA: hypothetical protein VJB14_04415 [Planctomycetota bacterium]|nr:hypothetical protein [Planctomycetota bacterium]